MMYTHETFLLAYDSFVYEIFSYFLSKTVNREEAKKLTQQTFAKTWREVQVGNTVRDIHHLLYKNADLLSAQRSLTFAV
jgi:hypothetical protein